MDLAALAASYLRSKGWSVEPPRPGVVDPMRVLSSTQVGPHTYEIVAESARYGRVKRRVLVLSNLGD